MKTSKVKGLLLSLLITGAVILLKLNEQEAPLEKEIVQFENMRNLQQNATFNAMYGSSCIKGNVTLGYASNFVGLANTVSQYINNLTKVNTNITVKIEKVILNGGTNNTSAITELVVAIFAPYLIIAIFAIVTIIFWIIYCVCCCKQCCCCNSFKAEEGLCSFKGLSCMIFLAGLVGVVACCIVGWIFSKNFPTHVNDIECSLLKFYSDVKYGQNITTTPRWIGVSQIGTTFSNLIGALNQVQQNSRISYFNNNNSTAQQSTYYDLLDKTYTNFQGVTVRNPNPSSSSSYSPTFIKQFGPRSTPGSTMGNLQLEYDLTITGSQTLLGKLEQSVNSLSPVIQAGITQLQSASDATKSFNTQIDVYQNDYIDKFSQNVSI